MFFADFIKNTLSGNNAIHWNYYNMDGRNLDVFNANSSINFIKDYFAHGEKNFPLILNSERANHFIKEYFTAGSVYVKLYIKSVLESNRLCKDTSCKCEKYAIYRKTSLHNIL